MQGHALARHAHARLDGELATVEKFFLRIFFFFLFFFSFRSGQQASSGSGELFGFCPSFGQRAYALGGGGRSEGTAVVSEDDDGDTEEEEEKEAGEGGLCRYQRSTTSRYLGSTRGWWSDKASHFGSKRWQDSTRHKARLSCKCAAHSVPETRRSSCSGAEVQIAEAASVGRNGRRSQLHPPR